MFPKVTQLEINIEPQETIQLGKSFLYDFKTNQFVMENGKNVVVEGIEALKVWIEKTIRTEKYRYKVYERANDRENEYGIQLKDLIGNQYAKEFVKSELKREVTNALLKHPAISGISNWALSRQGSVLIISFAVRLKNGVVFSQEVSING